MSLSQAAATAGLSTRTKALVANIPGNFYDKYNTPNPIARFLMRGFLEAFDSLIAITGAKRVYEAGCGEGYLSCRLLERGLVVRGSDLEAVAVEQANYNASSLGYKKPFVVSSIYNLTRAEASADIVICCEVLEHLRNPHAALRTLSRLGSPFLLLLPSTRWAESEVRHE